MGLRSWFLERTRRMPKDHAQTAAASQEDAVGERSGAGSTAPSSEWVPLPAFLPVDPQEHTVACVIASAIAAGDRPESAFSVRRISIANPEYRRVAVIATALAAGALDSSSFTVKAIYKHQDEEGSHAA